MNKGVNYRYFSSKVNAEKKVAPQEKSKGSYAQVKDGKLIIHHPPEGPYPMVIPCPDIELIVNGRECTKPIPISMEDTVQLKTENEQKKGKWSIEISSDGLQAILKVTPTVLLHRKLSELPPSRMLYLKVEEQERPSSPFTMEELLQRLDKMDIKYGIDQKACSEAIECRETTEIVIARGTPPTSGEDGKVELLFTPAPKVPVTVQGDKTVDFRKRYVFTSVEAGEILAIKHPAKQGRSGTGVTGEVIQAPTPRDFILVAGEGVVLKENGKKAVADQPGRPSVSHKRNKVRISVINELIHTGDVDLDSGNIAFKGDILILGNVTENMIVESCQDVQIEGLVSHGRVNAKGSIIIKGNILSSSVTAGNTPDSERKVASQLQILADGLSKMVIIIRELLKHSHTKKEILSRSIGSFVALLMENEFCHLVTAIKNLNREFETTLQGMAAVGPKELNRDLERTLIKSPLTIKELSEIEALANRAREWEQIYEYGPPIEGHVTASSIQNSKIVATGNVQIVGSGCYISEIQAGKKVQVNGVFRGGTIRAGGDVYIKELGSKGGPTTKVITDPTAVVKIERAFVNSVISLGGRSHRFYREERNIRIKLDKNGALQLNY